MLLVCLTALVSACSAPKKPAASSKPTQPAVEEAGWKTYQTGTASWYGGRWHGRLTANGEHYNQNSLTAAHKTLPFGTKVRVTNISNGDSCIVRINNRGPYVRGRIIDLSVAAAKKIGSYSCGLTKVRLEVMK